MSIPERCLKCNWWNFTRRACDRIFKARIRVAIDGGEINLETQPGLLPADMEDEFAAWFFRAMGDLIDSWPGWNELKRIRDGGKSCAGEKPNAAIREYGIGLKLVNPLQPGSGGADPLSNRDHLGLFKADISPW